ncbi:MAG: hypothetical protein IIZ57_11085 [Solobacterium sp.]|nr:hypothetical protein [Solobacterium sp.]
MAKTGKGRAMIVLFVLLFVLNCLAVPTQDDMGYQINNGLLDILHREYVQYMTWTGRTTAHLIARCFLAMPKIVFNVCNSLCFVHLCNLMTAHAVGKKENDSWQIFSLSALMIFLFAPLFGQTCLWETGSCNYLWTTMIVMQFLMNYRLADAGDAGDHSWILMFLAGIPAGWTNENTGGALIMMILFLMFMQYLQKNIRPWMVSGLAGSLLGFVMLLIAPGNKVRAQDFVSTNGKAYDLMHDFYGMLTVFDQGQIWIWVLLAVSIAFLLTQKNSMKAVRTSLFYAIAGAAAVGAIILSPVPVLYDRSMFGGTVMLITAVLTAAVAIEYSEYSRRASVVAMMVMLLFSGFHYLRAAADLAYTRYQYRNREAYVKQQRELGNLNPTVPIIYDEFMTPYNPMYGLGDIDFFRLLWSNKYYAETHGLESVQATALDHWSLIYKNGDPELMNITEMSDYLEAAVNKGYTLLINSSWIDSNVYANEIHMLGNIGLDIVQKGTIHLAAVYENGTIVNKAVSPLPVDIEGNAECGAYYYISSNDNVYYSDIVVNGVEYTNDNEGVTVVVLDEQQNRVVDSITFYPWSDQGGIRYYVEK